jgi:hypothetical protein
MLLAMGHVAEAPGSVAALFGASAAVVSTPLQPFGALQIIWHI